MKASCASRVLCAVFAIASLAGCSGSSSGADASVGGVDSGALPAVDAGTDAGQCTPSSQAANYPVKVLIAVQSSGGMCIADPPGSQAAASFCDTIQTSATTPGRVKALHSFLDKNKARPNVFVSLIPWDTSVTNQYPSSGFVPASDGTLPAHLDSLQNSLGKGSDFQGALAGVSRTIEADLSAATAEVRAKTRYVVVFLSDGLPYPRCSASDGLTNWATPASPDGIWPDNPATFCNDTFDAGCDPCLVGFVPGGDRNQNSQLSDAAAAIAALKSKYQAGDVRVHTRLLLDASVLQSCGACLNDLGSGAATAAEARTEATFALTKIAQGGGGTFGDPGSPSVLSLDDIDMSETVTLCK